MAYVKPRQSSCVLTVPYGELEVRTGEVPSPGVTLPPDQAITRAKSR